MFICFIHLYMLLENSEKYSNLINLEEIYIVLYQQLESGKRLFTTLFLHIFDDNKSGIKI